MLLKSLTALAATTAIAATAAAAPLTVRIYDVEDRGGTLFVSVQTEAQFMKEDGVDGAVIETPTEGAQTLTFDVPPGAYSVSVWHDDNGNGEFDTMEPWGVPADGWAMSLNRQINAAPTFDDVSFDVPETGHKVTLEMTYGR